MSTACCDFRISENRRCGSYAFNLWQEGIEQKYCDRHHWQDEATRLRAEVEALRADAARLDCGQIMIDTRDEFGEPKQVWHTGMDLRKAIDAARAAQGDK